MIGELISRRYKVLEKIGEGGMAVVYKATDTLLNRPVAIKVLREQYTADEQFVQRFRREAQAAASLSHPNVVNIYDVGETGDAHFIVMEYVEGSTLKQLIRERGGLPQEAACAISLQIAYALEHAHKHGLVHRDIKPHNILVTEDGRVKVTDFGIARAASGATLTQTGFVVGSVHYFSPEQARGENITHQSDLYSLGVLMYELFTGRVPFTGESAVAVALKHVQDDPRPPRKINREISPAMEKIVLKAMEKDLARRYQNAGEMIRDLQKVCSPGEVTITPGLGEDERTRVLKALDGEQTTVQSFQEEDILARKKERQERKKRRRRRTYILLFTFAFLGGLIYALSLLPEYVFPEEVDVPDVVGKSFAEAEAILRERNLSIAIDREAYTNEVEVGHIISQDPSAGRTVKEGRRVNVVVSLGPELVEVPDVTGLTVREAGLKLDEVGLKVGQKRSTYDARAEAGIVLEQEPVAGSFLAKGLTVDIVVNTTSSQASQFTMPDLRGEYLDDARARLRELGLAPGNIWSEPSELPEWQIIDHNPPPGATVSPGTAVDFVYSEGSSNPGLPSAGDEEEADSASPSGDGSLGESDSSSQTGADNRVRKADVQISMPPGPAQEVEIYVIDVDGVRRVYKGVHEGGTSFVRRVQGRGEDARIQVYIDGKQVDERPFPD